jgi:gliding motility-associated lipoprotein GldD
VPPKSTKYHSFEAMRNLLVTILIVVLISSCGPDTYTPKPRGYYELELPKEHSYKLFDQPGFPYSFEYPTYSTIIRDSSFFGERPENPYWIYIDFPSLNARIYLSYKAMSAKYNLSKLLNDSHDLSYFHSKKADYIGENVYKNPNGVSGIFYNVGGNAASTYQFMATDSIQHFIRAGLYFNVSPNADSLKPVNDFLRIDIEHILYTLKWK